MKDYLFTLVAVCLVMGVISMLGSSGRGERLAIGIITLYVTVAPLVTAISDIDLDELFTPPDNITGNYDDGYKEVAEDAFADGIARAVADRFLVNISDVGVTLYGFDFDTMRAERINIVLSGGAIFTDYKAVESYVNDMDIGVTNAEIKAR